VGQLYSLEARSAVKQFVTDTERAIRAGRLEPGGGFSLREPAEQRSIRWPVLRAQLSPLERDGLLAVGSNGSVTVAPLDANEIEGMARFRLLVLPDLAARAAARRRPEATTRLRVARSWASSVDQLPVPANTDLDGMWSGPGMTEFWRDAASTVEIQQALLFFANVQRYQRLGFLYLVNESTEALELQRDLHAGFGDLVSTDPVAALAAAIRVNELQNEICRLAPRVAETAATRSRVFADKRPALRLV
jgi:hypothetical protein